MKVKSIATRITIPIVLVILVAGIITVEVVRRTFQKTLTVALKEKGMSVCKYLAVTSLEPVLADNEENLQQILQERMQAGLHRTQIDGKDWSSGIYWVRLESGTQAVMRKIVCIK